MEPPAVESVSKLRMRDVKSDFTAEDAEVFAEDAEKYCPLRTSASASASSAVERVLSLASCSSFDKGSYARGYYLPPANTGSSSRLFTFPLLVRNRTGYQNLCRLITLMKLRVPKHAKP